MFNPKELNRVQTANLRSKGVDYDLAYSEKTEKFRVSPEIYEETDMQNHGLTLVEDSKNNELFLGAEPNDVAVMHKGKEGFTKGREFKASRLRVKLDRNGFKGVNRFALEFMDTVDGVRWYKITSDEEGETSTDDDPTPVDYVPVDTDEAPKDEAPSDPGQSEEAKPETQELPDYGDVGAIEEQPEPEPEDDKPKGTDHDDLDSLLG